MTITEPAVTSEEQRVVDLVEELLEKFPPRSTTAQGVPGRAVRPRSGLGALPRGRRRPRPAAAAAEDDQRARWPRAGGPNPAYRNPIGYGMCGADGRRVRQRRAEDALPAAAVHRRGDLVPAVLRAGRRLRLRRAVATGVRDGDEWVVNGQKVWTTLAHVVALRLLVARTDPDVAQAPGPHAFVVDMHAPGVEVRPLRQMTGEAEFNEVYFTDVRIPDAERLGERRRRLAGVAHDAHERAGVDRRRRPPQGSGPIADGGAAVEGAARGPQGPGHPRRARCGCGPRPRSVRLTNIRALRRTASSACPGPRARSASWLRRAQQGDLRVLRDLWAPTACSTAPTTMIRPDDGDGLRHRRRRRSCAARANSIEGGTSEVMRNILGERVLGLPGDVRVDRDAALERRPPELSLRWPAPLRFADLLLAPLGNRCSGGPAPAGRAGPPPMIRQGTDRRAASTSLAAAAGRPSPWSSAARQRRGGQLDRGLQVAEVAGGGKYSSSSVSCTSSTPSRGASRAMTASTSSSGADAPAVTPTVPWRSSGSSSAPLTR